ncbi:MAG: acetyl-CoA carboxylase biotin carboxyl carrier protein subunit, partial [Oceanococcaceae bacterium]
QSGADFSSELSGWRSANPVADTILLRWEGQDQAVKLMHQGGGHCLLQVCSEEFALQAGNCDGRIRQFTWENARRSAAYTRDGDQLWLSVRHRNWCFSDVTYEAERPAAPGSDGRICAHSDGRIVDIRVEVGQDVAAGESIVGLEAMKMQFQLTTPVAARVREVHVAAGDQVSNRQLLVTLEPHSAD